MWRRALALILLAATAVAETPEGLRRLVVLHTNDIHGQCRAREFRVDDGEAADEPRFIGGLPRVAAYVARVRAEVDGPREGLLVLDGGDWFQGTPEGLLDDGEAFTQALVAVGYDALVVGNHEFDHGVPRLRALIEDTGIPCVLANVREPETGDRVTWARPWRVFERADLRVGVVGLLTPETPSITHADARALTFTDPIEELTRARRELADESLDLLIPLTHLGLHHDRELARAHPDLPLVIGGHSHTYLEEGEMVGDCLVCQVGSKASSVGRVDLWFDAKTREMVRRDYRVIDLFDEPAEGRNAAVDDAVGAMLARSEEAMAEAIGVLDAPLDRSFERLRSSGAGNCITDWMRERTGAQVAIQNRGGIRCDLPAGTLTRRDAFELLPFGNHIVELELAGSEFRKVVERALGGQARSGLEFSGMQVVVTPLDDGTGRLESILIGGEPLDPTSTVRVATNDFLARGGGDFFEGLDVRVVREDPIRLRELFEARLRELGRFTPDTTNRYTIRGAR